MKNITEITDSLGIVHVVIDNGNGNFTSMPKSEYDRQQAEQANQPIGGNK